MAQQDEPSQKACIYKLKKPTDYSIKQAPPVSNTGGTSAMNEIDDKFLQVRVKSFDYMQKKATAIFFYDFTSTIETLLLREKLLEKEK